VDPYWIEYKVTASFMERRTIIVGDIHSCSGELSQLLAEIQVTPDDTVVAAGDLLDRGPDPWGVYEQFASRPNRLAILGNHERKHLLGYYSKSQDITRKLLGERYGVVHAWLRTLPLWLDLPEALVVHAAYVPGRPMEEQDPCILAGHLSGERMLKEVFPDGRWWNAHDLAKPVAFGHEVHEKVELVPGRVYALDGGCAKGGSLHALVLPEKRLVSVKARRNYWAEARCRVAVETSAPGGGKALEELLDAAVSRIEALAGSLLAGVPREARAEAWTRIKDHPVAGLLMKSHKGTLSTASVLSRWNTLDKLRELVESLGR